VETVLRATVWRGSVVEASLSVHVAVACDGDSEQASDGTTTTLRSCVKPLQALVFLRTAAEAVGATAEDIAIACSSHNGEAAHVAAVRSLLQRGGVSEGSLACGPQRPTDQASADALIAEGLRALPIHNNCSGKHAAMLAACRVNAWPLEGYVLFDHPLQSAVRAAMSEFLHVDLDSAPNGVDGCGIPTYGVPLQSVARAFAEAQRDPAFSRAQSAMASHPHLVAGTGRFDTALLDACGDRVTSKIGGAAVWAGCVRPDGPGVAVKVEAGADIAVAPAALAVLRRLGVGPRGGWEGVLGDFERPLIHNLSGDVVGELRLDESGLAAVRPPSL